MIMWLTVSMSTGNGKSTLFKHYYEVLEKVRRRCGVGDNDPASLVNHSAIEKMAAIMSKNGSRLFGLYGELSASLNQRNHYRGRGLTVKQELAVFLQLYNGYPWRRDTGIKFSQLNTFI